MMNVNAKLLPLLPIIAVLAACGGGGGDVPPVVTSPLPGFPLPAASTPLVTSVPAPTHAAGSEELAAFNMLNTHRERCGFGLVAQNTQLDQAARGHANWVLTNGFSEHTQDAGSPGFTGTDAYARIAAAGYEVPGQFWASEEFVVRRGTADKTNFASFAVRTLLNAPYHAAGLLAGYKDIGVSVLSSTEVQTPFRPAVAVQLNPTNKHVNGLQEPPAGSIRTFPCEGSTGVDYSLDDEEPNPVPGRNLRQNPLGSTITIRGNEGSRLIVSSATMINTVTGASVALRSPVGMANDVHGMLQANQAFVSADSPMSPETTYQASITGTIDGTAFSRTFTFRTAGI